MIIWLMNELHFKDPFVVRDTKLSKIVSYFGMQGTLNCGDKRTRWIVCPKSHSFRRILPQPSRSHSRAINTFNKTYMVSGSSRWFDSSRVLLHNTRIFTFIAFGVPNEPFSKGGAPLLQTSRLNRFSHWRWQLLRSHGPSYPKVRLNFPIYKYFVPKRCIRRTLITPSPSASRIPLHLEFLWQWVAEELCFRNMELRGLEN